MKSDLSMETYACPPKILKTDAAMNYRGPIFILALFVVFFFGAAFWHWLGPIRGKYDFIAALTTLWSEFSRWYAGPLFACAVLAPLLHSPSHASTLLKKIRFPRAQILFLSTVVLFLSEIFFPLFGYLAIVWSVSVSIAFLLLINCLGIIRLFITSTISIVSYLLIGYGFTIVKLSAFMNGAPWDDFLLEMDEKLGLSSLRIGLIYHAHSNAFYKQIADISYQLILITMVAFSLSAALLGKNTYTRYILSISFVYLIGGFCYMIFPAWGPFVFPEFKAMVGDWFSGGSQVGEIQNHIVENSLNVVNGNLQFDTIRPYAFVSAMPSLHIATPLAAFLVFKPHAIALRTLAISITLVSAWAALVTGMHYVIDIFAGIILAYISVKITNNFYQKNYT
jgi:hypothetical protein